MTDRLTVEADRSAIRLPMAKAARHRTDFGIAHLLQRVGCQCGSVAAATVENDFGIGVGHALGDMIFENAASDSQRTGNMSGAVLILLADIDDDRLRVADLRLDTIFVDFDDALTAAQVELEALALG